MSKRIVIVDDANFIRKQLIEEIELLGHQVVAEGKNGLDAIDLYKKNKPDIIFMDINMPVMDGVHAISAIRKMDQNSKIVVVSSVSAEINLNELRAQGVTAFIKKPFTMDDIKNVLDHLHAVEGRD